MSTAWTKTPPTEPGDYWIRSPKVPKRIAYFLGAEWHFMGTDCAATTDQLEPDAEFARVVEPEQVENVRTFKTRAAEALADEVSVLISRKVIDSRSPAADALLDYHETKMRTPRSDRIAELEQEVERLRAAAPKTLSPAFGWIAVKTSPVIPAGSFWANDEWLKSQTSSEPAPKMPQVYVRPEPLDEVGRFVTQPNAPFGSPFNAADKLQSGGFVLDPSVLDAVLKAAAEGVVNPLTGEVEKTRSIAELIAAVQKLPDPEKALGAVVAGDNVRPSSYAQWKGTALCADIYCRCGYHSHIDAGFVYFVRCPKCRRVFMLSPHVRLIEVEARDPWPEMLCEPKEAR